VIGFEGAPLRAGFVCLLAASLSCAASPAPPAPPASFRGSWEGVLLAPPDSTLTSLVLDQRGEAVTGTLGLGATLLGHVDGDQLTFTLDFAGTCAATAAGSAWIERLPDRDRLHLAYHGASTCAATVEGAARLDRLRCPARALACSGLYASDRVPYCASASSDPLNCGACGVRCDGAFQVCAAGRCQVPVCTGPVPLGAPLTYPVADSAWALVLADLDADGRPDAILPGFQQGGSQHVVAVLLRDGGGGFAPAITTDLSALFAGAPMYSPSAIAAGDLDGDGRMDLAAYVGALPYPDTATSQGELVTLLGNGNGSFRAGERLATGPDESIMYLGTRVVAVADLDGDGVDDVAARSGLAAAVQVRLGRAGGALGTRREHAIPAPVDAMAVADVDGDGIPDLLVASGGPDLGTGSDQVVVVLRGRGDGTFGDPVVSAGVPSPQDLAVGDFDEDGVPDLVVVGWWSWASHPVPNVSVLLGNGDGSFGAPATLDGNDWSWSWSLAVVDLDGDGHLDLAVGDDERGLDLFLGHGDGTFQRLEFPVAGGAGLVVAADLDGDGRPDLVVGDEGGRNDVAVYRACGP
jgi:hypothetical protein